MCSVLLHRWCGEQELEHFLQMTSMKIMRKPFSGEKIFFMLPTGNVGKKYIKEVTRLLNTWRQDVPLRSFSLNAIHTMPVLLLQK